MIEVMHGLAWVGLGANEGRVLETLAKTRQALQRISAAPLVVSPLVESAAWGPVSQPSFLNQVVGITPILGPHATLAFLQEVEAQHGRRRFFRWGPRTLDLDLLCWPGVELFTAGLVLPHPHLANRRFVLEPWAQVAPRYRVSGLGKTVAELLVACGDPGFVRSLSLSSGVPPTASLPI